MGQPDVYDDLIATFHPLVSSYPHTSNIESDYKKINFLTPGQVRMVQGCQPHQYISGAAGTGKTEIIITKVAEQKLQDDKKLVLCYNSGLKDYLQKVRLNGIPSLDVMNVWGLLYKIISNCHDWSEAELKQEKSVEKLVEIALQLPTLQPSYKHIFVDEAQDLSGRWQDLLDRLHEKGDYNYMWVFYDDNQKVRYSNWAPPTGNVYKLCDVIRNPRNVFQESLRYYSCEDSRECTVHPDTPEGPHVERITNDLNEEDVTTFTEKVVTIIAGCVTKVKDDLQVLKPGDVAVLVNNIESSRRLVDQLISHVEKEKKEVKNGTAPLIESHYVEEMLDYMRDDRWPENRQSHCGITVDSFARYKGLESKVVILIVPDLFSYPHRAIENLYVGVTRSCCKLVMVCTERSKELMDKKYPK